MRPSIIDLRQEIIIQSKRWYILIWLLLLMSPSNETVIVIIGVSGVLVWTSRVQFSFYWFYDLLSVEKVIVVLCLLFLLEISEQS